MHQQPPRPHQGADAMEAEQSAASKVGALDALRFSKAGSMIGRPAAAAHATTATQDNRLPARTSQATLTHESPAQQEGAAPGAAASQGAAQRTSVVRFPHEDQVVALQSPPAAEQHQLDDWWSAAAHLQAVEMLLNAAQHVPSSPQVALQHLQSISLLCQSCVASLAGVPGARTVAAPLHSMQIMCASATETSLQQPHAQHALWVSLRLLCRTVNSTFDS